MIRQWETSTRYYVARLEEDLLGDVVLVCINGGKGNRLGRTVTIVQPDEKAGLQEMERIDKLRRSHDYIEVIIDC